MKIFQTDAELPAPGDRPAPPARLSLGPRVLAETQSQLRHESGGRREALTLWAGRPNGVSSMLVTHVITPRLTSDRNWLTVPFDERALVASYLRQQRLLAVADLHTHPESAFLSDADRNRPFSSRDGFYAVVIPRFATNADGIGWRFYVSKSGDWVELDASTVVDAWPG